jgi:hypothetical protein
MRVVIVFELLINSAIKIVVIASLPARSRFGKGRYLRGKCGARSNLEWHGQIASPNHKSITGARNDGHLCVLHQPKRRED